MNIRRPIIHGGWSIVAALLLSGCAEQSPAPPEARAFEAKSAVFVNGDFESGTNNQPPPSWTVTPLFNPNPGVTIQTPQTRAGLGLLTAPTPGNAALIARTVILLINGGPES